jgi:hypothetical protein
MAPLDQYLMERNAEIALARSAAPESISQDAEVMVLGPHGYETAVQGKNGFVCIVERSWTSPIDDPGFWNPKGRAPLCLNAAAARSYLPRTIRKTDLILAGRTKAQMMEAILAAIDKKELPTMEPGAMCYMLSKQGHLSDRDPHWHPHLMFFYSRTEPAAWGAGLPGSSIFAFNDTWALRCNVAVTATPNSQQVEVLRLHVCLTSAVTPSQGGRTYNSRNFNAL